jgi:hypothetical protein
MPLLTIETLGDCYDNKVLYLCFVKHNIYGSRIRQKGD